MSSQPALLPCVEIEPAGPARASVIWLHGLGADGHDFEPIVPELRLPDALGVRFLLPHAPSIPVTINGGMRMPAWYDIRDLDLRTRHDPVGIARSQAQVEALIAREVERGIDPRRIALVGFSQGTMMALHVGLRRRRAPAALLGFSGELVGPEHMAQATARNAKGEAPPVLLIHGTKDEVIPFDALFDSAEHLAKADIPTQWHISAGLGHSIDQAGLVHGGLFLAKAFGVRLPSR